MVRLGLTALATLVMASGCASLGGNTVTTTPIPIATPADAFGCGIGISGSGPYGTDVILGEPVRIVREAGPECLTMLPSTVQRIEFETRGFAGAVTTSSPEFTVAADGSFATEITVPATAAIGFAVLTLVPPNELDCRNREPVGQEECNFPSVYVTPTFPEADLKLINIVEANMPLPEIPDEPASPETGAWVFAGPADGELTVTVGGDGCVTVPKRYLSTADPSTLVLVTGHEDDGITSCNEPYVLWTSVITIPDGFEDFTSVTVDNSPAMLVDVAD
ncbi:MAG: hypothetical protein JWQ43_421 [Glaciihabitans sp.]|nr:hypothetical protein [Glaciihabitans sp.]